MTWVGDRGVLPGSKGINDCAGGVLILCVETDDAFDQAKIGIPADVERLPGASGKMIADLPGGSQENSGRTLPPVS